MVPSALNVKRKQQLQPQKSQFQFVAAPASSNAMEPKNMVQEEHERKSAAVTANLSYQATENEYDPMFPNNYEAFCNQQIREQKQRKLLEELAEREIIIQEQVHEFILHFYLVRSV